MIFRTLVYVVIAAGLASCTLPWRNQYTTDQGTTPDPPLIDSNAIAEDWMRARDGFRERVDEARDDVSVRPLELAGLVYEYGRTSGVLCDWETAHRSLTEAYDIDKANGGPSHMSLVELARMNIAQQRHEDARRYFSLAIPELEASDAERRDPMGFVDIMEEYSAVLSSVGEMQEATSLRERANALRENAVNQTARTDITPYGAYCDAPSS